MGELKVSPLGGGRFRVDVTKEGETSRHEVTVSPESMIRFGWTGTPEDLIRHSFDFLLERESMDSILSKFEISDIVTYFPEFEEAVRKGFTAPST